MAWVVNIQFLESVQHHFIIQSYFYEPKSFSSFDSDAYPEFCFFGFIEIQCFPAVLFIERQTVAAVQGFFGIPWPNLQASL